ncbi:hypothetical protein DES36_11510 [Alkalibaculum bacchi]|uniref:Hydrogenase nickel incorporation protein HypA/HybF n=1 Tax=Alkalibaculum bacchi TaxID=645887 RepID=A0A366I0W1_9FIRM|nr:hypothetical protein [Alkalibaculum bacchi]RBP61012.1 hypothetical protein DES36_11510 [Alkalibaculum bacchi]
MHDTFLLQKISDSLREICSKNKIKTIEGFTLIVNHNSHINEENLLEHLRLYNSDITGREIIIKIYREDIGGQSAIIKSIQGETFEV